MLQATGDSTDPRRVHTLPVPRGILEEVIQGHAVAPEAMVADVVGSHWETMAGLLTGPTKQALEQQLKQECNIIEKCRF